MSKKIHRIVIIGAILATFASGCRSTQEYERLAKAGSAYSIAVNELLEARGNIRIDNTSEQLLYLDREDRLQTSEDYRELSTIDLEQLVILERIQKHNQLLSRYFFLLGQLANSKAPEDAQAAIGNIVTNLGTVSKQLQPLVEKREAVGSITRLVVSGKIRGALRDELEERKDTIQAELILQQKLLDLLAEQIENNLKDIKVRREERLVIKPLTNDKPITAQDEWVANRREVLTMETTAKELRTASDAANEFREVFEDFVSGKLTATRINIFLTDIQSFVGVIESLKKMSDRTDMTNNELQQAKQALIKLKAKIDLVDTDKIVKKSVREKFFDCQNQCFILIGKLENAELKEIADKLGSLEAEFKRGISNLETQIKKVNDAPAFLGVIDNVTSTLARIATILA